jgi:hyperosmotically inducible protein
MKRNLLGVLALAVALAPVAAAHNRTDTLSPEARLTRTVGKRLANLPDYGVYDWLTYSVNNGVVKLQGYAETPVLRSDADHVAVKVAGVQKVENDIKVLPPSSMDDQIRRAIFFRIYRSPALSRYAAGGGLIPGDPLLRPPLGWWAAPAGSFEPAGNYAIHIIVDNGNVKLEGVVNSKLDRQVAGTIAMQIPGVFSVANNLVVAS